MPEFKPLPKGSSIADLKKSLNLVAEKTTNSINQIQKMEEDWQSNFHQDFKTWKANKKGGQQTT